MFSSLTTIPLLLSLFSKKQNINSSATKRRILGENETEEELRLHIKTNDHFDSIGNRALAIEVFLQSVNTTSAPQQKF